MFCFVLDVCSGYKAPNHLQSCAPDYGQETDSDSVSRRVENLDDQTTDDTQFPQCENLNSKKTFPKQRSLE